MIEKNKFYIFKSVKVIIFILFFVIWSWKNSQVLMKF